MNVQGTNAAALSGTARAQAKGSDTEANKNAETSASRRESPGQSSDGDQLSIDPSGQTDDRDGDGRLPYAAGRDNNEPESDAEIVDQKSAANAEGVGEQLDLEA